MTEENSSSTDNLESKIIEVMSTHPKGVSHDILLKFIPSMSTVQLCKSLNTLLTQEKVQLLQKKNVLVYKLKASSSSRKYDECSDVEEKSIFQAVERAGNNGVSSKDLKFQLNLAQPLITKVLKKLESKRLVKSITSTSKKKLFILYDLEPSQAITGGIFFSGQEFESEYVDGIGLACYRYLMTAKSDAKKDLSDPLAQRKASFKSSKDICDHVNSIGLSTVELTLKDVEAILESLVYDGNIEKNVLFSKKENSTMNLFRIMGPLVKSAGLVQIPCGVCRVRQDCHIGGNISPATCIYMKEWLDF